MSPAKADGLERYADAVTGIARRAGDRILEIYEQDFDVQTKQDGSPVTTADRLAHELIAEELDRLDPGIPMLSEESPPAAFDARRGWQRYWLVDPLDGTKEFISRRGEFTVNIALVSGTRPVLGVVHTPAKQSTHWGWEGGSAYVRRAGDSPRTIRVRRFRGGTPTIVASRSHGRGNLERFLAAVAREYGGYELTSMGSALKICIVAEGGADVYPRLGPTSEWDTAAAQCVLTAAGGVVSDCRQGPLRYGKESILNPWFIASGGDVDWCRYVPDAEAAPSA